jgi:deoxyhypusine synthase
MEPGVRVYNLVLACCAEARQWRKGLMVRRHGRTKLTHIHRPTHNYTFADALLWSYQIYKEMVESRLSLNSNTYQMIVEMGRRAADEPCCVYDAMKFAGVPLYIAYSAATANAEARGPPFQPWPEVDARGARRR